MENGSTPRSSGPEIVAPAGCQGPRFFLAPTPNRCGADSAAYTPSAATTVSCTACHGRGGPASKRPVEAAGPVDAQTDARPQGPWTPANGRRRPQLPQAPAPEVYNHSGNDLAPLTSVGDTHRPTLGVAAFQPFPPGRVSTFGDTRRRRVPSGLGRGSSGNGRPAGLRGPSAFRGRRCSAPSRRDSCGRTDRPARYRARREAMRSGSASRSEETRIERLSCAGQARVVRCGLQGRFRR